MHSRPFKLKKAVTPLGTFKKRRESPETDLWNFAICWLFRAVLALAGGGLSYDSLATLLLGSDVSSMAGFRGRRVWNATFQL